MRTLGVFAFTFVFIAVFFWACCAFIGAVPNPMNWKSEGRFAYVFITVIIGGAVATMAAVAYEHEHG